MFVYTFLFLRIWTRTWFWFLITAALPFCTMFVTAFGLIPSLPCLYILCKMWMIWHWYVYIICNDTYLYLHYSHMHTDHFDCVFHYLMDSNEILFCNRHSSIYHRIYTIDGFSPNCLFLSTLDLCCYCLYDSIIFVVTMVFALLIYLNIFQC